MDASVTIIRRPVKHARLRVQEDTSVQLIVPDCFEQPLIDSLLRKKAAWIVRNQQFFRDRQSARPAPAADQILLFDGIFHFAPAPDLGCQVLVDEASKEIRSGRDLTRPAILSGWYRTFAHTHLSTRISELSAEHRLPFKRLFIRSQRTKWGTCSTKGNISLNWRLVLAPKYVGEYVILHELMHTKVLNHSHRFWVLLKAIYPRCGEAIRWLNTHPPPS